MKLLLEACQMMEAAYPEGVAPYKRTHPNHPMSVWVRASQDNFLTTLNYCYALCAENVHRYGKKHKSQDIADWYSDNLPDHLPNIGPTDPPRCFNEFKGIIPETDCVVTDYRNYYNASKRHLFKWKNRDKPDWIK